MGEKVKREIEGKGEGKNGKMGLEVDVNVRFVMK